MCECCVVGFLIVVALVVIGFWLRSQPFSPWLTRKMPPVLVVLESWCFFAWFYGQRLVGNNVDGYLANSSDSAADYQRGVDITNCAGAIGGVVAAIGAVAVIYGAIVISSAKKKAAAENAGKL